MLLLSKHQLADILALHSIRACRKYRSDLCHAKVIFSMCPNFFIQETYTIDSSNVLLKHIKKLARVISFTENTEAANIKNFQHIARLKSTRLISVCVVWLAISV